MIEKKSKFNNKPILFFNHTNNFKVSLWHQYEIISLIFCFNFFTTNNKLVKLKENTKNKYH